MKRFLCFFFCLLILVTSLPTVYAADSFDIDEDFDPYGSDVEEDLSNFYIDGKAFNEADYPVDKTNNQMRLIFLYEYGYIPREDYIDRSDASKAENFYELFFYVYNPSCLTVSEWSNRDKVQLSLSNALELGYHKFDLYLVDQSEDGRFLKYCIWDYSFPDPYADNGFDTEHFSYYLGSDCRKYFVSGIEIETQEKGVVEYTVANDYTFTGSCFDGTLQFTNKELTVLKLDVHSTFFRTETSSKGVGYQNQLDSVYFSIPNSVLDYFGNVYAIHFDTTKKRVNGITHADPLALYFTAKSRTGLPLTDYASFVDTNFRYGLEDLSLAWYSLRLQNNGMFSSLPALGWNARAEKNIDYLFWTEFYDLSDMIPGEKILEYLKKYDLVNKTAWIDKLPLSEQPFISPVKTEHISPWIDVNDRFDLLSYNTNHSFFEKLFDYGLFNGDFGNDSEVNIKAIIPVKPSDITGTNEAIADKLLIDINDVDELKAYVDDNSHSTTYLFRFAQQDYYAEDVFIYDYNNPDYIGVKPGSVAGTQYAWEDVEKDGYYWEQTAYLDFDIIEIQFLKEGVGYTTLPVVSSPIDIVGDATPPFVPPLGFLGIDLEDWGSAGKAGGTILGIILIIALIVFVIWLILWLRKRKRRGRRSGTVIIINGDDNSSRRRRRRK